jgi:hypothetical protein
MYRLRAFLELLSYLLLENNEYERKLTVIKNLVGRSEQCCRA